MDIAYIAIASALTGQGLLAAGLLWLAARSRPQLVWLGVFVFGYSLTFAAEAFLEARLFQTDVRLTLPFFAAYLALGPALYLYVDRTICPDHAGRRRDYVLHSVLPLTGMVAASGLLLVPADARLALQQNGFVTDHLALGLSLDAAQSVLLIQTTGYLALIGARLWRHRRRARAHFSNLDKKLFDWLSLAITGLATIWTLDLLIDPDRFPPVFEAIAPAAFMILEAGILYGIAAFGYRQRRLFLAPPGKAMQRNGKDRYAKSGLSDERIAAIAARLDRVLEKEAVYRDPDLTLSELAKRVAVPPAHLSETISRGRNENFYGLIARYRVSYAQDLMSQAETGRNLLDIAFAAGFSTKSSFNAAFKRETGLSPTQWRAAHVPEAPRRQNQPGARNSGA